MPRFLTRWGLVALAWFMLVPVVQAQFVVFTVQSVDAVLDQVRHTLTLAGKEEEARQLDGMLQAFLADDGFKGLDTKKPLGFYLNKLENFDPQKPPVVAFIPVSSEKEFLALLGKFNLPIPEPDKNGMHRLELGVITISIRFAHNHAFVAVDEGVLEGDLPDPASMLTDLNRKHLLAVAANIEQLPASLKTKILEGMAREMEKQADASGDKAREQNLKAQKMMHDAFKQLLDETKQISLTAHHDRQSRRLRVDFAITPRSGSKMATQLQGMQGKHSVFAALAGDAAMNFFLHFPIDGELRQALDQAIEEGFQEALREEKSFAKKAVAEKAFKVLAPTLKSDVLDVFATVRGPQSDGKFTLLAGLRIKNGQEIEQLLKNFLNDLPEKDRANVQMDAEKIGDLSVHKLKFPEGDKDAMRIFGSSEAYVVIAKDYALFTVGQHGMEELKQALPRVGRDAERSGMPMHMTFSVRRLLHFESDDAKRARAAAAAKEVFTGDDQDRIQVTWSGDGAYRLRFEMSDHLIKFFALIGEGGN